jgi:hypothetical protein
MNPLLSTLSRYFRRHRRDRGRTRTGRRKARRPRLCLETLEDRTVPSATISIANASLNEIGDGSAFVAAGSGGLSGPKDLVQGPDGDVYVASSGSNSVIRYTSSGQLLGTFVAAASGGLSGPYGPAFGPDGNLYVDSTTNNNILEYNGSTGAFLSTFVAAGSGGLSDPRGMIFGQDGNLYVSSRGTQSVDRYQGPTGASPGSPLPAAGQSGATFVATGSGGLAGPLDLLFGPNGNLFVANGTPPTGITNSNYGVLEFNGTSGGFLATYVASNHVTDPRGLAFDQDGRLYVADEATNALHRFDSQGNYLDDPVTSSVSSLQGPIGMAFDAHGGLLVSSRDGNAVGRYDRGVTVTLSAASATPVSVAYATADGTATAPLDYTAQSGTVTFAPGQTSRLVLLATHYDSAVDGNETFSVQLSNPTGATIGTGTATVTIVEPVHTSYSGSVFNDLNGNGTQDVGEPGLAGWKVWLDDDRDGIFNNNEASAVTDANGKYFLDTTGQRLGTGPSSIYYLAFGLPVGDGGRWVPTTPVFAPDDPTTEPNAIRNFGVKFQPFGSIGPAGSETAVNVNTAESVSTENGSPGKVANVLSADANGDYVVAWQSPQGNGTAVSARVFNADGSPKTGELAVGTGSTGTGVPSVAMAGNGQFVVAWQNGSVISMAIYQLNGSLVSNSNTINSNWLQGVAADSVGNFAVLYGGKKNRLGVEQPTVQRYTKSGATNGNAIIVASFGLLNYDSAIAMDGNGNFTVSWDSVSAVSFQRYTSAGRTNGSPVSVAQSSTQTLVLHSLAMNSAGQFVETWGPYGFSSLACYAQLYTSAGSPSGSAVTVTSSLTGSTVMTTAIDTAGNVTFAWSGDSSTIGNSTYLYNVGNVHYRQLTATGQLTPELIANTTTQGYHGAAGIAATGKGSFVIAWVGNGAGDAFGIDLQRFAPGAQIGSFSASASAVTGGSSLTLTASNFTDPNAGTTITQVAFYATDSTGNQYFLGYGKNNNGVWMLTFTVSLAPGSYTLFAEATDNLGILGGDSALLGLTVS